jgi:hypothetical protein
MNKVLSIFVFYSEDGQRLSHPDTESHLANRYKHTRWLQAALFVLSVASGMGLIYRVNYSNWLVNMQQVSGSWSTPKRLLFKGFGTVPAAGDYLGLYHPSTGSWPCGDGPGSRGRLGAVVRSATGFQLAQPTTNSHIGRSRVSLEEYFFDPAALANVRMDIRVAVFIIAQ